MTPNQPLTERAREMFAVIERYRESGLKQKPFCHSEGLTLATFYYWLARYKQYHSTEKPTNSFIELKARPPAAAAGDTIILTYPNGVTLRFPLNAIDLAGLKALITLTLD